MLQIFPPAPTFEYFKTSTLFTDFLFYLSTPPIRFSICHPNGFIFKTHRLNGSQYLLEIFPHDETFLTVKLLIPVNFIEHCSKFNGQNFFIMWENFKQILATIQSV